MRNTKNLAEILKVNEPVHVVDVGSSTIEGRAVYQDLIDARLCRLIAFEPQIETMAGAATGEDALVLPVAVGDGSPATFYTCRHSGWSGCFEPSARTLDVFTQYADNAKVIGATKMQTRRLDDIAEIERIDFLKIDVQGGELSVFRGGRNKLKDAVFIQTEVWFVPGYEGQPVLGDVDLDLRGLGFVPHCFAGVKKAIIPPLMLNNNPWTTLNQLLDGDLVYVRDFRNLGALSVRQLQMMALVADVCYQSYDLACRAIHELRLRNEVPLSAAERYLAHVNEQIRAMAL